MMMIAPVMTGEGSDSAVSRDAQQDQPPYGEGEGWPLSSSSSSSRSSSSQESVGAPVGGEEGFPSYPHHNKNNTRSQPQQTCAPCPSGMECHGGADVWPCALATYSGGNRSKCAPCTVCQEITVAWCNATHDSVCEATPYPLAVITLTQRYRTMVSGEVFAMFALVFASSIPKVQLVRVCRAPATTAGDQEEEGGAPAPCVRCFQGKCPVERMKRLMPAAGPEHEYMLEIEIRPNAVRLSSNVESLTQTAFLPELAKTTMSKFTDIPFTLHTRVEHSVICPDAGAWNGGECVPQYSAATSTRAWLGLGTSIVVLALIGAYGGRIRQRREEQAAAAASKQRWAMVEEVTEADE